MLCPNPGEVNDRMTILTLKLEYCEKYKIHNVHYLTEYRELQKYLEENFYRTLPKEQGVKVDTLAAELKAINRQLWRCRQDLFKSRNELTLSKTQQLVDLYVTLQELRRNTVKKINDLFGIQLDSTRFFMD